MLNQLSNHTSCSVLPSIPSFHLAISRRTIKLLIASTLTMKPGRFKIKHSLFGYNRLFRNLYYHVFLARITLIRFRRRFMSALAFIRSPVRVSFALRCVLLLLTANRWMSTCAKSKDMLMNLPTSEFLFVTRSMLIVGQMASVILRRG